MIGKLILFIASVLVLGGLLAPRIVRFVAKFDVHEALLIVVLGLCFGLALIAHQMGISAAVGAFPIGTVLGDSEQLLVMVRPVRDMFAALLFVSIGMLVDFSLFPSYIVPALIIAAVFISGKIVANTVVTFFAGYGGRTSLAVGMGMPQMGEFSLAMARIGTDYGVHGVFAYPAITITTVITSFLYPWVSRSASSVETILEQKSPALLRQYVSNMGLMLSAIRTSFGPRGGLAAHLRRHSRMLLINIGIVILVFGAGAFLPRYIEPLAGAAIHLDRTLVALLIGGAALVLSMPSAYAMWREIRSLTDDVVAYLIERRPLATRRWPQAELRRLLRDGITGAILFCSRLLLLRWYPISFCSARPLWLLQHSQFYWS